MLRRALVLTACAALFTLGCDDGSDTASSDQTSAGSGGSSATSSSASGDGDGSGGSGGSAPMPLGCDASAPGTTTISCVESFTPGDGAGHGADDFPAIIYGPPHGAGSHGGSTDVLSLGTDGSIVVGFGGSGIVDGEGADFIVFENAFWKGGNPAYPYSELAEISVSDDGATWTAFPCKHDAVPYDGCAGWHPVFSSPDNTISPLDPATAGGEAFDLATLGVTSARFLRIKDLHNLAGLDGTTGFDLDAVAVIHAAPLPQSKSRKASSASFSSSLSASSPAGAPSWKNPAGPPKRARSSTSRSVLADPLVK
jgi:hypothetical protein